MRISVSTDLRVILEGVGDVRDEDGAPVGRGIIVSVGGEVVAGKRRHKLYVSVTEEGIARLAPFVGEAFSGRLSFEIEEG